MKKLSKEEVQEQAKRLMKAHNKKQVFATGDDNFFFLKSDAANHNATLKTDENPEPEILEFKAEEAVVETPVVEAPVVETPVVETPVVETPVVETPVVDTPVVETPVVETPVVETPVVETPVVETHSSSSRKRN